MTSYSSLLITSLMFLLTILCSSEFIFAAESSTTIEPHWKYFGGNFSDVFKEFSNIPGSSNAFVKLMRETLSGYVDFVNKETTKVSDAVNQAMEMEKQIQNISQTLKSSTITLSEDLQLELSEIEKNVSIEITKLNEIGGAKNIEKMKTKVQNYFDEMQKNIQKISSLTLTVFSGTEKDINVTATGFLMENKMLEFVNNVMPSLLTTSKEMDSFSHELGNTYAILSNIRQSLERMEKIEFTLLHSDAAHAETFSVSLLRSLLMQCAFAIMFGMLF